MSPALTFPIVNTKLGKSCDTVTTGLWDVFVTAATLIIGFLMHLYIKNKYRIQMLHHWIQMLYQYPWLSMVQALCNISELSWPSLSWTLYIIDMKTNSGEKHILIVSHPTIMMLFQFNIKNIKHSSHNHNQKIKNAKWAKPSSSSLPKYHTG